MLGFVYKKENLTDGSEIAFSTLKGTLDSEGIGRMYMTARKMLNAGETLIFGNFKIRKLTLIHQHYGKRKTRQPD